jgi:DNA topoisomerase-2
MDGLKTSLRKILFTAFKRRLNNELKVAQFSGSVSEMSCYHHGEQSLNGAIVGMAQNFVGSNNINLLEPKGQFGTRLQGGEDSASERYIFTQLSKVTRRLFPEADDCVLTYLDDDGTPVEPIHYTPIIPMILVNGSKGIGTGFSTDIMCHSPLSVITYVIHAISGKDTSSLTIPPYYEGFKGKISQINDTKYLIKGCYDIISEKKVRVTELPVGTWTDNYKQYIEELIEGDTSKKAGAKKKKSASLVKDYVDMSTDTTVDITITFATGVLNGLVMSETEYGCNALEKLLKLYTTRTTTNMHMFDEKEKLRKFSCAKDIANHYIDVRLKTYVARKKHQLGALMRDAMVLSNKARFISAVLDGTLDMRRKKKSEVSEMLCNADYDVVDDDADYKYLVRLPMDSVTEENVLKLMTDKEQKLVEVNVLKATSEQKLWLNELDGLKAEYLRYTSSRAEGGKPTKAKKKRKLKLNVK